MTTTNGLASVFLTTHNWGKYVSFLQSLGYELEFETDHHSGLLRNGDGPYLFVAEVPESEAPGAQLVLGVADPDSVELSSSVDVVSPFEDTHWGTKEMTVRDPDGRIWSLQTAAS